MDAVLWYLSRIDQFIHIGKLDWNCELCFWDENWSTKLFKPEEIDMKNEGNEPQYQGEKTYMKCQLLIRQTFCGASPKKRINLFLSLESVLSFLLNLRRRSWRINRRRSFEVAIATNLWRDRRRNLRWRDFRSSWRSLTIILVNSKSRNMEMWLVHAKALDSGDWISHSLNYL